MTLAAPLGLLLGFTALAIVGLYVLKPKRKTVVVSSVLPFSHAQREATPTSPWQRLRRNPLLILQVLAALLFTLLLARPRLSDWRGKPDKGDVLLVLDNSVSMSAKQGGATRLDLAKRLARRFLDTAPAGARVALVSMAPRPALLLPPTGYLPRVARAADAVPPAFTGASLAALGDFLSQWPQAKNATVVLVSDGAEQGELALPQGMKVKWLSVGGPAPNRGFAEGQLQPVGKKGLYRLSARVASPGLNDAFEVTLKVNNLPVRRLALSPQAGGALIKERLALNPGEVLSLHLPPDAQPLDNTLHLPVRPPALLKLAWVTQHPNPFLSEALRAAPGVLVSQVASAGAAQALSPDITLYEESPPARWPQKGESWWLGVTPSGTPRQSAKNAVELLAPRALQPWAEGLNLKGVLVGRFFKPKLPPWFTAALVEGDHVLAWQGRTPGGRVVLFPFSLWDTDLVLSVAFPVMINRLLEEARQSQAATAPLLTPLGAPLALPALAPQGVAKLPAGKGKPNDVPLRASSGWWRLPPLLNPGVVTVTGGPQTTQVGVALLGDEETDLTPGRWRLGAKSGGGPPRPMQQAARGLDLFPWLLAALAALIAAEWWAYHRLKRVL